MKIKLKILIFTIITLLCLSFIAQTPAQAYSSDSFNTSTGKEYVWEVDRINVSYFIDPYLTQVGDRLKLVITKANMTEIGGVTYDSIYGKLYHNTVVNRTWIQIDPPGPVLLAIYNGTYLEVIDRPYIISRNEDENIDWFFEFLSYGTGGAKTMYDHRIYYSYKSPAYGIGNPYEEYDYKDGLLVAFGFARGNGTAWDVHTLIVKISDGGIPGFPILSTILILTSFIAVYALLANKKQKIFN